MQRKLTYETRNNLHYYYANESLPTSIPVAQISNKKHIHRVQASSTNLINTMPPVGSFALTNPRRTSSTTFSIGGALNLGLDERSISAQIPIASDKWRAVQDILGGRPATLPGDAAVYKSVYVVLNGIELTSRGKNGGYFYQIYLNFPSPDGISPVQPLLLGTLGPFEINGASHHGSAQLKYLVERRISAVSTLRAASGTVSFVRINGDNRPVGPVIGVGEVRLELSTKAIQQP
jgi:tyrosinase